MSRSCHSATSSSARLGVAAEHAREAGDALGRDRVALVRHRARALLAGAERLLHLADLGALEVADLGREALQPGARERDRLQHLGVAVARHDLGGDRLAGEPEPLEHARLVLRPERGVRADGAGDRPRRRLVERALQPLGVAVGLEREPGELEPERRRLGVDAVGAPDAERAGVLARPLGQRGGERPRAGHDQRRRRGAAAAPAPCRARRRTSARSGSSGPPRPADAPSTSTNAATSWSVTRSRSFTASTVNVAVRIACRSASVGPVERLGRGDLDVAPGGHARLVGPDGADLRSGVALDHACEDAGGEHGGVARRCRRRRRRPGRRAASGRSRAARRGRRRPTCSTSAARR